MKKSKTYFDKGDIVNIDPTGVNHPIHNPYTVISCDREIAILSYKDSNNIYQETWEFTENLSIVIPD